MVGIGRGVMHEINQVMMGLEEGTWMKLTRVDAVSSKFINSQTLCLQLKGPL